MAANAPRTARARARTELTAEIKQVARSQLAEEGAAALSLRAVARELGMVSSAVYRYFPSRDELLTALIIDAYDAVGEVVEQSEKTLAHQPTAARMLRLCRAVRAWALQHPHEYALVYGSPVPGYRAPADTIDPASRVSLAFLRLVASGVARGDIVEGRSAPIPRTVRADLARLRALAGVDVPDAVLVRGLQMWAQLFGHLTLELFGHLRNVIHDHDSFFDLEMRQAMRHLAGATLP